MAIKKVMIHSNAPWMPSGYGVQCGLLARLLKEAGYDVAVSAFAGHSGAPIEWEGLMILPAGRLDFSPDVIAPHAAHFGADLTITLMDFWQLLSAAGDLRTMRLAAWLPVDTTPLGKPDRAALSASQAHPIAMSKFGAAQLQDGGYEPLYAPHSVDTEVFTPSPTRDAMRADLGLTGRFVVGINAANRDAIRKAWPQQLQAFRKFHAKHPDSLLLIHSMHDGGSKGLPLSKMVEEFGLEGSVLWSDQYAQIAGLMGPEIMAGWYNALDVLLGASMAEAFGVPLIEAQACGTPVITTHGSAMKELVGPGWMVTGEDFWNPIHGAWWVSPSIDGIAKALERAYLSSRSQTAKRREAARRFAMNYDHRAVFSTHWRPLISTLAEWDPPPVVVEYDGLKWHIGDFRNRCGDLLALGHESDLTDHIMGLLPADGVFLDVGAHVGHWTLRAARQCAKVIAIEANPETFQGLKDNIALNEITNVEGYAIAAWDENVPLDIFSPNAYDHDGSTRVLPPAGTGLDTVMGVPLDSVLDIEDRLDLVKLDVEGADLHALSGMAGTLARLRPVLFIEDHSLYGFYDRRDLETLLDHLAYTWEDLPLYKGYLIARPRQ